MRSWITLALLVGISNAHALSVVFNITHPTCTYATGTVQAVAQGGVGPYTYLWTGGGTASGLIDLVAGDYTVTVTDFLGAQVTETATLIAQDYYPIVDFQHVYCPGQEYHAFFLPQGPGNGGQWDPQYAPYTTTVGDPVEVPGLEGQGSYYLLPNVADGGSFIIDYWDVNGCHGELSGTAGYLVDWPVFSVLSIEGSCSNVANGSVTFATSGEGHDLDVMYQVLDDNAVPMGFPPVVTGLAGTYTIGSLAPGTYDLAVRTMFTPSSIQGAYCSSSDTIEVVVPDLGPGCGQVSGTVYIDIDGDCIRDFTDVDLPNTLLEILPGPYYVGSSYGYYSTVLPWGTYTIGTTATNAVQSCPSSFTLDAGNITEQLDLGHTSTMPLDVSIGMASGPARPGFILNQALYVNNNSVQSTGNITVTMQFDPLLGFVGATPTQTSVAGNTITWVRPPFSAFQDDVISIQFQVPPDIGLLGTQLAHTASAMPQLTDANLVNNTVTSYTTIVGSVDPNDKLARTSTGASEDLYFINEDEWIDYTIRFQNTGTDTAFTVVLTDTLPSTLDLSTLRIEAASHPFEWSLSNGTLHVMFPGIMLPDSNVNEPRSHGFVALRIAPIQPLLSGTAIENIANIYFDYNAPVITEPSVLTAEFSTGVELHERGRISLAPVPASNELIVSSGTAIGLVRVLSADGREVMRMNARSTRASMDLNGLRSGAYLVVAELEDGNTARERFIKQ